MTLSFSKKFPDKKPTFFVEKVWRSILAAKLSDIETYRKFKTQHEENFSKIWVEDGSTISQNCTPKIHTIREDKKERWKSGHNIHFVINNRTKDRFQFAPLLKVKSVKRFEVKKNQIMHTNKINGTPYVDKTRYSVFVDDEEIGECLFGHESMEKEDRAFLLEYNDQIFTLAMNDGFKSVTDFFNWFSDDFQGKLISRTDFSYSRGA